MKTILPTILAFAGLSSAAPATPSPTALSPPAPATVTKVPTYNFTQLYHATTHFLDQMMYPNNVEQARSVNSTLFAKDVVGRIEQVRSFHGRQENTEWLFNLFTNDLLHPDIEGLFGVPLNYNITKFTANENVIAVDAVVTLNVTVIGITAPLGLAAFMTFDSTGAVSEYDMTFRYLERNFQYLFQEAGKRSGANATATGNYVTSLLAESICGVATKYCHGAEQQYNSTDSCVKYLSAIDFGGADVLGSDNLICRMLHQTLVPSRPQKYCPAIGPSGGQYCSAALQTEYVQIITDPLFVNYPFVPYGYANKDPNVAAE